MPHCSCGHSFVKSIDVGIAAHSAFCLHFKKKQGVPIWQEVCVGTVLWVCAFLVIWNSYFLPVADGFACFQGFKTEEEMLSYLTAKYQKAIADEDDLFACVQDMMMAISSFPKSSDSKPREVSTYDNDLIAEGKKNIQDIPVFCVCGTGWWCILSKGWSCQGMGKDYSAEKEPSLPQR